MPVVIFIPTPRKERAIQNPAVLEKMESGAATVAETPHFQVRGFCIT